MSAPVAPEVDSEWAARAGFIKIHFAKLLENFVFITQKFDFIR